MTDEREPLTPPEADLRDFAFTPMYRARLFGSGFHARASDSEWRAGVTLWLKSQDQVPAGSLPDDDVELCRLAELARDFKTWNKLRNGALRGWERYSDGRLYHPVVAQITLEQWIGKLDQRKRTIKARIANLDTKLEKAASETSKLDLADSILEMRQEEQRIISYLSHANELLEAVSVTETVTRSKRERQRERQGQGDSKKEDASPPTTETPAAPSAPLTPKERLWRDGPSAVGALAQQPPAKFRSIIGGWLKTSTPEQVLEAIAKAQVEKTIDPVPYITACLNRSRKQAAASNGGLIPLDF